MLNFFLLNRVPEFWCRGCVVAPEREFRVHFGGWEEVRFARHGNAVDGREVVVAGLEDHLDVSRGKLFRRHDRLCLYTRKKILLSTGWSIRLYTMFCWHQIERCVLEEGGYAVTELLFWCQQKVVYNLMDLPVSYLECPHLPTLELRPSRWLMRPR